MVIDAKAWEAVVNGWTPPMEKDDQGWKKKNSNGQPKKMSYPPTTLGLSM